MGDRVAKVGLCRFLGAKGHERERVECNRRFEVGRKEDFILRNVSGYKKRAHFAH